MAASAVTAAVIPSKSDKKEIKFDAGSLTFSTAQNDNNAGGAVHSNSISCELDTADDVITDAACNVTVGSETSEATGSQNSTSISTTNNAEGVAGPNNLGADNTSDS